MLKVSIIVPVYNSEKYLKECLDSILGQTYSNIEVLCVNDGSKDKSLDILKEYVKKDSRIKVYTKENEGKGAASARNLGLKNATGDYVQFLDSDDFFEPDMVESLVDKIEETESDVVIYRADRYDDKIKSVTQPYVSIELQYAPKKEYFSYRDCKEKIFQVGDLIAWNKIYRRSMLIENDMWFEPIAISDDQFIPAISLVTAERISCIDRVFLHYRFNTGHSQVDSQPKHPEAAYAATSAIVDRMRKLNVYSEVKRSYLNMAIRLMREYFDNMTSYETIKFLYNKYLNEVFPALEAEGLTKDFFYDERIGEWYEMIVSNSLEEILFMACRGYGTPWTTAILRFQVPYEKIPKGGNIVLVGKGIIAKYWYAQLLLSNYCNVISWVDEEKNIPANLEYDYLLSASK